MCLNSQYSQTKTIKWSQLSKLTELRCSMKLTRLSGALTVLLLSRGSTNVRWSHVCTSFPSILNAFSLYDDDRVFTGSELNFEAKTFSWHRLSRFFILSPLRYQWSRLLIFPYFLFQFETRQIEKCLDYIYKTAMQGVQSSQLCQQVYVTGGGAYKYSGILCLM